MLIDPAVYVIKIKKQWYSAVDVMFRVRWGVNICLVSEAETRGGVIIIILLSEDFPFHQ